MCYFFPPPPFVIWNLTQPRPPAQWAPLQSPSEVALLFSRASEASWARPPGSDTFFFSNQWEEQHSFHTKSWKMIWKNDMNMICRWFWKMICRWFWKMICRWFWKMMSGNVWCFFWFPKSVGTLGLAAPTDLGVAASQLKIIAAGRSYSPKWNNKASPETLFNEKRISNWKVNTCFKSNALKYLQCVFF